VHGVVSFSHLSWRRISITIVIIIIVVVVVVIIIILIIIIIITPTGQRPGGSADVRVLAASDQFPAQAEPGGPVGNVFQANQRRGQGGGGGAAAACAPERKPCVNRLFSTQEEEEAEERRIPNAPQPPHAAPEQSVVAKRVNTGWISGQEEWLANIIFNICEHQTKHGTTCLAPVATKPMHCDDAA
jgi:hypothetical protein